MKNKIIKIIYLLLILLVIVVTLYLLIRPRQKEVVETLYDSSEKNTFVKYEKEVKEIIHITHESVFRVMIFLNEENKYDNLNIKILDANNTEIFNLFVPEYQSSAMYFEFPVLNDNSDYILIITDIDGDDIELATLNSNGKAKLLSDSSKCLQTVIYYYQNANNYLWYPLFLAALLLTFYPFIWEGEKHEKE